MAVAFAYQAQFVQSSFESESDVKPARPMSGGAETLSSAAEQLERLITEKEFERLASEWRRTRNPISSADDESCGESPPYQQIIGLGWPVLRLLLREINRDEPEPWFWALAAIARENPVPPASQGNLRATRDAWLRWGAERKLINADELGG